MLYWECKRRLALLRRFRVLAFDYFENIQHAHWMAGGAPPSMNDKAQKARHEMNHIMGDVVLSFDLLVIPHVVFYQPPHGGYAQTLDVIVNAFDLYSFQITPHKVFDCTDRAVGAYESECRRLLRKSFNPLYWLEVLIVWFLQLPFRLLGAAGFDAGKAEHSLWGKIFKVGLGLVPFTAAAVVVADHWTMIRTFIGRCLATAFPTRTGLGISNGSFTGGLPTYLLPYFAAQPLPIATLVRSFHASSQSCLSNSSLSFFVK
jgi:hypothetical protein